jgi:hypothetical protein
MIERVLHAIPPDSKKDRYLYTASVEKIRRKNKLSESEEDDEFLKDNKIHPIDLPAEADYCDYGHQATSYRLAHSQGSSSWRIFPLQRSLEERNEI